mmetsp:Transcript_45029/g.101350  ORF Transcript_45029/g.101350 Transcript_45029/m.101350 type:complete len:201 (-) Transcript_45029:600-1202(-)
MSSCWLHSFGVCWPLGIAAVGGQPKAAGDCWPPRGVAEPCWHPAKGTGACWPQVAYATGDCWPFIGVAAPCWQAPPNARGDCWPHPGSTNDCWLQPLNPMGVCWPPMGDISTLDAPNHCCICMSPATPQDTICGGGCTPAAAEGAVRPGNTPGTAPGQGAGTAGGGAKGCPGAWCLFAGDDPCSRERCMACCPRACSHSR